MSTASPIDSFFIALGFKVDGKGIDDLKGKVDAAKESMLGWGVALTGIVSGLALHEVAKIGSTFESNRIQIAGFLQALEISSDFNAGLKDADATIQSITTAAARLPGEAEEYIDVFKTGISFVQEAMPGGSLKDMTDFTNKLTAIGKSMQLPADQIGREMMEILAPDKGNAQKRNRLFIEFLPLMKKLEGQAHLTAESFNQMTAPQRAQLLERTFEKMQPMLDASANSFDAMWGAMVSGLKQVTRLGTQGLFSGMKGALDQLNGMFFKADGSMTDLGKSTVAGIASISRVFSTFLRDIVQLVGWFAKLEHGGTAAKLALGALGALLTGLAIDKTVGKLMAMAKVFKLSTMLAGALAIGIYLVAEDIWGFYHGAESVTGHFPKLMATIAVGLGTLGAAFVTLKLISVASAIATGLAWAAANIPILLAVAAIALIGIAIYEVWKHWDKMLASMTKGWNDFVAALKSAPHDIKVAFGLGTDAEQAAAKAKQDAFGTGKTSKWSTPAGGDVIWRNPATGLEETHRAGWAAPAPGGAAGGAAGRAAPAPGGALHIAKIEVHANDAAGGRAAAREFVQIVRTHKSGVVR